MSGIKRLVMLENNGTSEPTNEDLKEESVCDCEDSSETE